MKLPRALVHAVLIGRAQPFLQPGTWSAIDKHVVHGPIALGLPGLAGDEHGDNVHHGGPDKALLHYAFEHYATWERDDATLADILKSPGAFGENISSVGFTEADVCVGDVFRLGSALVQASHPRRPCLRLNIRFRNERMAGDVQRTGRCGWYYRVLEPGVICEGDVLRLEQRPNPTWTMLRVFRTLCSPRAQPGEVSRIASLPFLADAIRMALRRRMPANQ
jgi:MOSC domain-containing protein YiiM